MEIKNLFHFTASVVQISMKRSQVECEIAWKHIGESREATDGLKNLRTRLTAKSAVIHSDPVETRVSCSVIRSRFLPHCHHKHKLSMFFFRCLQLYEITMEKWLILHEPPGQEPFTFLGVLIVYPHVCSPVGPAVLFGYN